ncbi:hypothetical protein E2C01_050956 [Portunus trituberculatus]|uniref:Uncharacterized protein n=1 Tax=Portunus trituberculatus TaxID=210409 RepID=A0A5B7GIW8_PORTR|nr:hypothetical protein [Portunus trituberculatus]
MTSPPILVRQPRQYHFGDADTLTPAGCRGPPRAGAAAPGTAVAPRAEGSTPSPWIMQQHRNNPNEQQ